MWGNVEKCKWIYFRENSVSGAAQTKKRMSLYFSSLYICDNDTCRWFCGECFVVYSPWHKFMTSKHGCRHVALSSLSPVKFTFWWWLWSCLGQSLLSVSVCHSRNSVLNLFPHNGPLHSIKNLQNKNELEYFIFFISKSFFIRREIQVWMFDFNIHK